MRRVSARVWLGVNVGIGVSEVGVNQGGKNSLGG